MPKLTRKRSAANKKQTKSRSRKRSASSKSVSGYCVKCREARTMGKPNLVITKNKRRMMRGKCPICKTIMTKFVK